MQKGFKPHGLPVLIGSLPNDDHAEAIKLVLEHTPQIPLWVQLPAFREEGMTAQFLPGFPGLTTTKDKSFIHTAGDEFDGQLLEFYEEYMTVAEGGKDLEDSRFVLTTDTARGFFSFIDSIEILDPPPVALKGQITGPVTFGLGVTDQDGRAIFYNEQLRDAAVKHLALKAKWQVRMLSKFGYPVITFFDEPALAGFGSSAFIGISREEVASCLQEVVGAVHEEGGLAGIHVCANSDWSVILESTADIVSFDAYSFFDKFILYPQQIKTFLESGGILAWGIVPTSDADDIARETTDSLVAAWQDQARAVAELGIEPSKILAQSLITPSCGAGSLSIDRAARVLMLTREVSDAIRNRA
jgi:methionine synthase II (cobalamin-independent)